MQHSEPWESSVQFLHSSCGHIAAQSIEQDVRAEAVLGDSWKTKCLVVIVDDWRVQKPELYQWLSWAQAGPDTIQFHAMTESLKIIARRLHLDMAGIYVWLDIPQQNQRLKALAVKSLYTYARQADAIIIVAPDSQHHNQKIPANLQT